MQNVAVLFEQAAEQFAAAYPENGPLSPWITEQLGVTEPYLRGKAGVALLLLRLVQRQLTGNSIPLCRDMLPIEDRAAAVPELESVQIWWHRWLGCGIGMGFSGWGARLDFVPVKGLVWALEGFSLKNKSSGIVTGDFHEYVLGTSVTAYF